MKYFLVGGAVRDMLLGLEPKDSDYVVVGGTIEQMIELKFRQVGADFPVFLHPESGEEYALARSEKKVAPGYHGFKVEFSPTVTLEEDLIRRDLTINAMAIDADGNVVDPYGGQNDLKDKILRHTSLAFQEDPVRVLRLARFTARYTDFSVHPDTIDLMASMVENGELDHLTPDRVWAEFEKGLMEKKPSRMFKIIEQIGAAKLFKEFFDIWPGRYDALDEAAADNESFEVRFAIIGGGFKSNADYRKWRVAGDCEEVSALVNNNLHSFVNYESLSPQEVVQLFNRADLFRRQHRFAKIVTSAKYILAHSKKPVSFTHKVVEDMESVLAVDGGKIAMSMPDKTKIKDAIFAARVAAVIQ
jgi:tRNA nucleotidyltransferase (CCA-adding enzyme)